MPSPTPKPSDTSFRRTWDRTTYAAKAHDRDTLIKAEGAARAEAKSLGKKYIPRASTPPTPNPPPTEPAASTPRPTLAKSRWSPRGAVWARGEGARDSIARPAI